MKIFQLPSLFLLSFLVSASVDGFSPLAPSSPSITRHNQRRNDATTRENVLVLQGMKRPILDTLASSLFKLENSRVEASSEVDEKGRTGEPMEWSESSSFANKFSEAIATNSLGYQFKQFVADIVAGEYDETAVNAKIDNFINDKSSPVVMFSFTTCPFCRRAKDYLDEKGVSYNVMELDQLEGNEGNEIRAVLGKKIKRTSMPSIFISGESIGGCNDGPGLLPLGESGELDKMLQGA